MQSGESSRTTTVARRTPRRRRVFGTYEVLSRAGEGGMAAVFRARQLSGPRAGQLVAIKRLLPDVATNPEHVARFLREGELCRRLDHPSIVKVYEVGEIDGIPYIAMEFIDGRDLGQILERCRERRISLPIDFAVYLARVLLEALEAAHATLANECVVHCDVSPSNLFISRMGEIKLGDFGIARTVCTPQGEERNQTVGGKVGYLSPETIDGIVGPSRDLWAAAVMLYELLSLERPFAGETVEEVFRAIRRGRYRPLGQLRADIPPSLESTIDRALARRASARFSTAAQFAAALSSHYDERVGTPLAIAAVVRGLFGACEAFASAPTPTPVLSPVVEGGVQVH